MILKGWSFWGRFFYDKKALGEIINLSQLKDLFLSIQKIFKPLRLDQRTSSYGHTKFLNPPPPTHTHTHTYCQLEKLWCMVTGSFSIHHLGEQELLQHSAVSKHSHMLQLWVKTGHCTSLCHSHLVQWLTMGSLHQLNHNKAMDEVGTDPGWIEDRATRVEEDKTHNIVPNMSFFVDL